MLFAKLHSGLLDTQSKHFVVMIPTLPHCTRIFPTTAVYKHVEYTLTVKRNPGDMTEVSVSLHGTNFAEAKTTLRLVIVLPIGFKTLSSGTHTGFLSSTNAYCIA